MKRYLVTYDMPELLVNKREQKIRFNDIMQTMLVSIAGGLLSSSIVLIVYFILK